MALLSSFIILLGPAYRGNSRERVEVVSECDAIAFSLRLPLGCAGSVLRGVKFTYSRNNLLLT